MGRARIAIEALAKLAPETVMAHRQEAPWRSGSRIIAEVIVVRPNERLPAAGVVIVGTSSVNQAPVPGESSPSGRVPDRRCDGRNRHIRPRGAEAQSVCRNHRRLERNRGDGCLTF